MRVLQLNKNRSSDLRHGKQKTQILIIKLCEVHQQTVMGCLHKHIHYVHIAEAVLSTGQVKVRVGLNSQTCIDCGTSTRWM